MLVRKELDTGYPVFKTHINYTSDIYFTHRLTKLFMMSDPEEVLININSYLIFSETLKDSILTFKK